MSTQITPTAAALRAADSLEKSFAWNLSAQKTAEIIDRETGFPELIYVLTQIMDSLPRTRDWLSPDIEGMARSIIEKHSA